MADTIKLSGTYDSIEAYNILTDIEALEVTINGYKTDAETAATNAGTSETNAGTSATNAGTSESNASTYAGNALASANAAAGSESAAAGSAGAASASATLASQWATKTGGAVADGEYSAKYYAQAAANSATNAAASEAVVNGALPLSGGTMTGSIEFSAGLIKQATDSNNTIIYGGTDNNSGGWIGAWGKDHADYPGYFGLHANNGVNDKTLVGRPDGTLKWDNSNVVTNTTVHNLLTVETKTSSSATISANGTKAFSISVSKSGYTPIGIVGFSVDGSSRSRAGIFSCSLSSTTVTMDVWNQATSSVTWTASADVLYVKNSI